MSQETWHNDNDEIPPEKNPKELVSEAFGQLCQEHLTSVLKFLARFGTKGMPTEDMTQEVFLRVCKRFRRSQPPSDAKASEAMRRLTLNAMSAAVRAIR